MLFGRESDSSALAALFGLAMAALFLVPLASLASMLLAGGDDTTWNHLTRTVIPELGANSLLLALMVGLGTAFVGTSCAWLTAAFEFPGRRHLEWLLMLPMAMPGYILAYAYTDFLQYSGPMQTALRATFGWETRADYWFPEIRSLPGAATVLTLALYPYVYALARVAFLEQSPAYVEAGRSFGLGRAGIFWRVSLPIARPAIAAGVALALMETLADYGTVAYFGIPTLTTGIFKAWFSQGDKIAAGRLAFLLLGLTLCCVIAELASRRNARYFQSGSKGERRVLLHGAHRWIASASCTVPLLAAFGIPLFILMRLAARNEEAGIPPGAWTAAFNSFSLAAAAAIITVFAGLLLAYAARVSGARSNRAINRLIATGYAIPGTVVAVGVLIPVAVFDHELTGLLERLTGETMPLLLTGSALLLLYAYLIRFQGIALHSIEAGLAKITPRMDEAARSLGKGAAAILARVHVPILTRSLAMAGLLVFVDVLKELPATLVLRPFNFDTLAVHAFTLAADERLAEAAYPSLAIVAVALLPVIIGSRAVIAGRR